MAPTLGGTSAPHDPRPNDMTARDALASPDADHALPDGGEPTTTTPAADAWRRWQPWFSTVLRLGLAGVALAAGLLKIGDLPGSVRATRAYELLPEVLVAPVGMALPMIEIIIGLLLLLGLFTRLSALAFGALMVAFTIAIASAWARGLAIDCGCFGGGGPIDPSETVYLQEILRDLAFVAGAALLMAWPRSRLSLDRPLGLEPTAR
ncbi:MauE/DoxX family redox-associated membrane protein [Actinotalea sp. K2]|uniref:MauE/DoxX family redox-associated membrane protein n=1 Tax=Actinotalea sp. K2 TaxID=2939438 RepID=UPI0020172F03|nr:MauE/DoxX family redox-associated membrane protein [Actinotalea sp. K2]MCL3861503.1 DoxX family membrane protein [Actinotalea sp. K2]